MAPVLKVWSHGKPGTVQTERAGRSLDSAQQLSGPIPPELGKLTNLVQLDLDSNALSGSIPPELTNCPNAAVMAHDNDLSGSIHLKSATWPHCATSSLGTTCSPGPVPPELARLTRLAGLALNGNRLTGSLPSAFRHLWDLTLEWGEQIPDPTEPALCAPTDRPFQLWLSLVTSGPPGPNCPNSGDLVADWRALVALYNDLNGSDWHRSDGWSSYDAMPAADELDAWYGVTVRDNRVVGLDLRDSGLQGRAPLELGYLNALESLDVSANSLIGPLPPGLVGLADLDSLRWGDQEFVAGQIGLCAPMDEAFQRWLAGVVDRVGAALAAQSGIRCGKTGRPWSNSTSPPMAPTGAITTIGPIRTRCPLRKNSIPGTASPYASGRVMGLELELNGLSGPLPAVLADLSSLTALNLRSNDLTGSIPAGFGRLIHLEALFLDGYRVDRVDSAGAGSLLRVSYLFLGDNDLSGSLPAELGNLRDVQQLNLYRNALTGPIPSQWGDLSNLFLLEAQ